MRPERLSDRSVYCIFQMVLKITCKFADWSVFGQFRLLCTTSGGPYGGAGSGVLCLVSRSSNRVGPAVAEKTPHPLVYERRGVPLIRSGLLTAEDVIGATEQGKA